MHNEFLADPLQYVYSAWSPQFAERLKLSSTESNLVGLFGNLGMYSMGVPIGMFIDHRGPRPAVLAGSVTLAIGYFPLRQAYDSASGSVPLLCFFYYLSGLGGCMAFAAAVKTSALNWPHHRGTATAFPLAAFGLSAFFFSFLGSVLFHGDPSKFLMLLAVGTCGMTFVGFFFLKVYPHSHSQYCPVPNPEGEEEEDEDEDVDGEEPPSESLRPTLSAESKRQLRAHSQRPEPGTSNITTTTTTTHHHHHHSRPSVSGDATEVVADETSSLLSSASGAPDAAASERNVDGAHVHHTDIRGLKLLKSLDFWQFFLVMALLAGIGLMTIK